MQHWICNTIFQILNTRYITSWKTIRSESLGPRLISLWLLLFDHATCAAPRLNSLSSGMQRWELLQQPSKNSVSKHFGMKSNYIRSIDDGEEMETCSDLQDQGVLFSTDFLWLFLLSLLLDEGAAADSKTILVVFQSFVSCWLLNRNSKYFMLIICFWFFDLEFLAEQHTIWRQLSE